MAGPASAGRVRREPGHLLAGTEGHLLTHRPGQRFFRLCRYIDLIVPELIEAASRTGQTRVAGDAQLARGGLSNSEIAAQLFLSVRTGLVTDG
jgi:hypothetical protein